MHILTENNHPNRLRLKAFIELTVAPTVRDGLHHLVHLSGLGGMKPNTIILGFPRHIIAPVPKQTAGIVTLSDRIDLTQRITAGSGIMPPSPYDAGVTTLSPASLLSGGDSSRANHNGIPNFNSNGRTVAGADDDLLLSFGSGGISLDEALLPAEFISILADCHRMQKNVCVARNFINLNKRLTIFDAAGSSSVFSSTSSVASAGRTESPSSGASSNTRFGRRSCYFDVWPIDFTNPLTKSQYDPSSLFMLQLSCIVAMTQAWKRRAWVRVFLPISASDGEAIEARHQQLERLLSVLRIKAQVERVYWDEQLALLGGHGRNVRDSLHLPTVYLAAIRSLITTNSRNSTVTFMYLPPVPLVRKAAAAEHTPGNGTNSAAKLSPEVIERYMTQIETLSDIGVPVLMVNAVHMVTTTTL